MFGRMKDPVEGTARLVSYNETNARNEFDVTVIAQLVVEADGLPATAVEAITGFPLSQMPMDAGTTFRVRVDRANPKHLKFLSDRAGAEAQVQQGRADAEQMAAAIRGGANPDVIPGIAGLGAMPGIQVIGADSAQAQEAIALAMERLGAAFGPTGQTPTGARGHPTAPADDDPLSKLERLAKLRDAGALTAEEFEAEKRRILAS